MAEPLPHEPTALQRTLVMSVVSIAAHALVGLVIALLPARSGRHLASVPVPEPIELDGSDLSAAESGMKGREDRAQGSPPAAQKPELVEPATPSGPVPAAPPVPPPAPEPKAPAPSPPPPPPAPPPPPPPPPGPTPEEASVEPHPAPIAPPTASISQPAEPPPRPKQPTKPPPRAPRSAESAAGAPGPTGAGTPRTPGSTETSSPEPGEGGGRLRVVARDLAASFARELPPASDSMPAWRTLPLGEVGEVTVELRTDDEGRLAGESTFAEKRPQEALAEVVKRTRGRLGRSVMAPAGKTAGPGVVKVRMRARIEAIAVPDDQPGGSFALGWKFDAEHGECTFSLQEGRRVTVTIDVVSRTPR